MQNFQELKLNPSLNASLIKMKFDTPTPIQIKSIPLILEKKDILASAQTGTGKTAAFCIPMIELIAQKKTKKAIILVPTRELAKQVNDVIEKLLFQQSVIKSVCLVGGEPMNKQLKRLKSGPQIIVGTPGRVNDHLKRKSLILHHVDLLILDEMDRMLDMGFSIQIDEIIKFLPKEKQTLMFSATLNREVMALADEHIGQYDVIDVAKEKVELTHITQQLFYVSKRNKIQLLKDHIKQGPALQTLIFTRTKHGADQLSKLLIDMHLKVAVIHGNKSQHQRLRALQGFKANKYEFLIATDVAARGLDIPALPRIINYDVPEQADAYIHRMGRTGRAGLSGNVYTYCSKEERLLLKPIFKELEAPLVSTNHPYEEIVEVKKPQTRPFAKKQGVYKNRLSGRKR